MRVGFFGQTGPYAPVALRALLGGGEGWELCLVVEGVRRSSSIRHRLRTPQPGPLPEGEDIAALAVAAGLPALTTSEVNEARTIRVMERFGVELVVCVGFDRLFSRELLAAAPRGGINAHPSPLPHLRGPAPIFWAARRGERNLAVTLHGLDPKEDHGPIYAQQPFELPRRATTDEIYLIAGALAGRMLREVLPRAAAGTLTGVAQDHAAATRAPRPRPEDSYIEPARWCCEHLLDFVNVAPFTRTAWTRLGEEVFFFRRGIGAHLGQRLPGVPAAMPDPVAAGGIEEPLLPPAPPSSTAALVDAGQAYVQQGATLLLQCRDGIAEVEIQV